MNKAGYSDDSAVQIVVRERPLPEAEQHGIIEYLEQSFNVLSVDDRYFAFDHVLGPTVTQAELFQRTIKPLVSKMKRGFNCTALAYGQTGTGKTYTMGLDSNDFDEENAGVIPRCLRELLAEDTEMPFVKREIYASFIEIYNEKAYDLLASNPSRAIAAKGSKFSGNIRKQLQTEEDCFEILKQGKKNRHVRPTNMNSQSSRSHAIFTLYMVCDYGEKITNSCLNLVDLAGSEGVRRTGHSGMAMSEGCNINQGLLCIGKVLQARSVGLKVIPYRDSVLSLVLQDSLNSNSYLTLVACVSPRQDDLSETLSTLRFAQNAKTVRNTPQLNAVLSEMKKLKSKTPFKTLQSKTPNINKHSNVNSNQRVQQSLKVIPSMLKKYGKTFCSANENTTIDGGKANKSDIGLTPKEKAKVRNVLQENSLCGLDVNNRGPLFDNSIESRFSLMSNISTSTALDLPTINKTSFSPLIQKCIEKLQPMMDAKVQSIIDSIQKTTAIEKPRLELDSPMDFRFPTVPSINSITEEPQRRRSKRLSVRNNLFASTLYEDTVVTKRSVRRSERILMINAIKTESFNDTTQNEQVTLSCNDSKPKRNRKKNRKSLIQMHKEYHNLIRLSTHKEVVEPDEEPVQNKKKNNKSVVDDSPIKPKSKKAFDNHRKTVLNLLNKGSLKQLMVLPQIGQKTAYQIVTQRTLNGNFKSLAQVEKLPVWRGTAWERFATANMLL